MCIVIPTNVSIPHLPANAHTHHHVPPHFISVILTCLFCGSIHRGTEGTCSSTPSLQSSLFDGGGTCIALTKAVTVLLNDQHDFIPCIKKNSSLCETL